MDTIFQSLITSMTYAKLLYHPFSFQHFLDGILIFLDAIASLDWGYEIELLTASIFTNRIPAERYQ